VRSRMSVDARGTLVFHIFAKIFFDAPRGVA
jgi:hypothetical protein